MHYDDLLASLRSDMRRIGRWLEIETPDRVWSLLVTAAGFDAMRRNHDRLVPDRNGCKDRAAFFREGTSGTGRALLREDEYRAYRTRVAAEVPAGLNGWLHGEAGSREGVGGRRGATGGF